MTSYKNSCSKMLEYRPPRIAMALLTVAVVIQYGLPIAWPALPSLLLSGGALVALALASCCGHGGCFSSTKPLFAQQRKQGQLLQATSMHSHGIRCIWEWC